MEKTSSSASIEARSPGVGGPKNGDSARTWAARLEVSTCEVALNDLAILLRQCARRDPMERARCDPCIEEFRCEQERPATSRSPLPCGLRRCGGFDIHI